ncbi:MAG: PIN domain-containing protein [Nitrospira sp.]|nr:PIN domain-containing protein [Nitrospira sp.]
MSLSAQLFRKSVFVDTSAFFALADQTDRLHHQARRYVELTDRLLVTSNVVVHETITLLCMRLGYEQALQFGIRLLGETTTPIIRVTQADEEKAWAIFRQYPDKRFSFADCTSFALMKRLGIGTAFAFDDDFRQFGKWVVHPLGEIR